MSETAAIVPSQHGHGSPGYVISRQIARVFWGAPHMRPISVISPLIRTTPPPRGGPSVREAACRRIGDSSRPDGRDEPRRIEKRRSRPRFSQNRCKFWGKQHKGVMTHSELERVFRRGAARWEPSSSIISTRVAAVHTGVTSTRLLTPPDQSQSTCSGLQTMIRRTTSMFITRAMTDRVTRGWLKTAPTKMMNTLTSRPNLK